MWNNPNVKELFSATHNTSAVTQISSTVPAQSSSSTQSSNPAQRSSSDQNLGSAQSTGPSTGVLVGALVSGIVGAALIAATFGILVLLRRRRSGVREPTQRQKTVTRHELAAQSKPGELSSEVELPDPSELLASTRWPRISVISSWL